MAFVLDAIVLIVAQGLHEFLLLVADILPLTQIEGM